MAGIQRGGSQTSAEVVWLTGMPNKITGTILTPKDSCVPSYQSKYHVKAQGK